MHTLLKILGLAFAALFVLPFVSAFPFTASISGPSAVSLLEGTSVTVPLEIQNNDFVSHTVTISGFSGESTVKIIPTLKTFTIAPYEKATVGITVRATDDADHDTILAKVTVKLDGQSTDVPLTVYVGSNPYLTLTTFNSVVCAGEYVESISVLVENRTTADMDVTLRAEQSILLPFTDDETVTLENGIEQYVTFSVNVSPQNVGTFSGTVVAETPQLVMVRPFAVKVNDCPVVQEKTISLKLPTKTYDLPKLKTTNIPITVKNLTDDAQFVEFFVDTEMGYTLNAITIAPNDTATINAAFSPDTTIPAGKKLVNITAIAGGYSITQSLNVNVLSLDLLELEPVSSVYDLTEGETKTMDFIVHNLGDSPQTVSFSTQQTIPDVSFTFSPATVTLNAGKSTRVSVSIHANNTVSVPRVNTFIVANGRTSALLPVAFTILPADESSVVVTFVSAPTEITLNADEQKEISVSIRNDSDSSVFGLHFKLVGVNGANISVIGPASITLAPHETKTIALKIVTQEDTPPGAYSPTLVVQGKNGVGSIPLVVRVNDSFVNGLLTGLVTFANERAGILGILVLVVLAGYYILSRAEKRSPVWTAK
jgi:uncharacterized membrane protein